MWQHDAPSHRRRCCRSGFFNRNNTTTTMLLKLVVLLLATATTTAAMGRLTAFLSAGSGSGSGGHACASTAKRGGGFLLPSPPLGPVLLPPALGGAEDGGPSSSPFLAPPEQQQQQQLAQVRGGGSGGTSGLARRAQTALLAIPAELAALATDPVGVGLGANTALALLGLAVKQRWLTPSGLLHAWILGVALWSTLGWRGWLVCVLYLVFGSLVTKVKQAEKEAKGIAEKRGGARGPENVWGSAAAVRRACVIKLSTDDCVCVCVRVHIPCSPFITSLLCYWTDD